MVGIFFFFFFNKEGKRKKEKEKRGLDEFYSVMQEYCATGVEFKQKHSLPSKDLLLREMQGLPLSPSLPQTFWL